MRVFVTDLHTTLGTTIARYLQDADHEVLGTVPSKSHLSQVRRKIQAHPSSDREDAVKDPVAVHTDKVSTTQLLQKADVVVATGLAVDIKATMELLKQYEKAAVAAGDDEEDTNAGGIRRFVAISSILTWSKNAVYANAKDQRGHSEDDFKTRKPARRYAELKTAETQILSANKPDEFETCVVAAGLIYGGAQSSLTPLFRNAWMYPDRELLVPALPGSSTAKHGENLLPMVSVYDLALLASRLAVTVSIPKNYIIATDKPSQSTTLRDVCVGLSVLLGNGKIRDELTEDEVEALLVSEDDADAEGGSGVLAALQLHLCFDGASETSVTTSLVPIEEYKHLSTGLLSNLAFYVEDFITSMDLRPLKTLVLGPPRVGKTTLCDLLAKDYYLPHITVESIADEILASIGVGGDGHQENGDSTSAAAEAKPEDETPGGITSDEDDPELQQLRVELLAWRATSDETKTASADELPEATIVALLRWKLATAKCRNQGFVLDGMPVSLEQASKIFEIVGQRENGKVGEDGGDADADAKAEPPVENPGDDAGGDGDEDAEPKSGSLSKSRSKAILDKLRPKKQIQFPNRVIVLQAPQVLLEQRAQTLSDDQAIATGNTQSQFATRYALFIGEAEGLATFFEQKSSGAIDGVEVLEIHLESEASYSDSDVFLMPVKKYMEQGGGKPHNFHPTREEIKQMERDFARKKQDEEDRVRQQELDQEDRDQAVQHAQMEAERARLEIIQREEAELLEARAKPLRTYLMDTVLPALTEGMLEIVKVQPDDPIDYLAEFLFKKGRDLETNES